MSMKNGPSTRLLGFLGMDAHMDNGSSLVHEETVPAKGREMLRGTLPFNLEMLGTDQCCIPDFGPLNPH